MSKKSSLSRRKFIRLSAVGIAALPLANQLSAQAAEQVQESDSLAQQLGYKHDASQVDAGKFPKRASAEGQTQFCSGCQFYQGSGDSAPCTVFGGKEVSAKGWCNSWFKKVG